jgi:hypothetical protein
MLLPGGIAENTQNTAVHTYSNIQFEQALIV